MTESGGAVTGWEALLRAQCSSSNPRRMSQGALRWGLFFPNKPRCERAYVFKGHLHLMLRPSLPPTPASAPTSAYKALTTWLLFLSPRSSPSLLTTSPPSPNNELPSDIEAAAHVSSTQMAILPFLSHHL